MYLLIPVLCFLKVLDSVWCPWRLSWGCKIQELLISVLLSGRWGEATHFLKSRSQHCSPDIARIRYLQPYWQLCQTAPESMSTVARPAHYSIPSFLFTSKTKTPTIKDTSPVWLYLLPNHNSTKLPVLKVVVSWCWLNTLFPLFPFI